MRADMTEGERIIDDCIAGIENFYARGEFPKRAGYITSYGKQIDALLTKDRETISDYRKAMNAISVAMSSAP